MEAKCTVCGDPARHVCLYCHSDFYCTISHGVTAWVSGHKEACGRHDATLEDDDVSRRGASVDAVDALVESQMARMLLLQQAGCPVE